MGRKNIDPEAIRAIVVGTSDAKDGGGDIFYGVQAVTGIIDTSYNDVEVANNNLLRTLFTFSETVKNFNTMLDDVATKFENVDIQLSNEMLAKEKRYAPAKDYHYPKADKIV